MVPTSTLEAEAEKAGLSPDQVEAVSAAYGESQLRALKTALFWAAMFAVIGVWFARRLPDKPLAKDVDLGVEPATD